jgi:hypothetical protein
MAVAPIDFGQFQGVRVIGWDLVSGETGLPFHVAPWPDKTVQIYGTFGTGNIQLEGSIDPLIPVFTVLTDVAGAAISAKVAAYYRAIETHCALIRPVATTISAVSVRVICSARRLF